MSIIDGKNIADAYDNRSMEDWCLLSTTAFNNLIDFGFVAGFNRHPIALRGDGRSCGVIALAIVLELLLV